MTRPCDDGVLVVVDLQQLEPGAAPTASCAPAGGDGVEALRGAGFEVTSSARFGRSFTCRLDGRPSADERLAIPGRDDYRESCVNTPPSGAYWSYWTAAPGTCDWTYSSVGATASSLRPGSAQGWSFALGATSGDAPAPRVGPCDDLDVAAHVAASSASSASSTTGDDPVRVDPLVAIGLLVLMILLGMLAARRRRRRSGERGSDA